MIYYEAIVGSRSSGIDLPKSDWDFFTCSNEKGETSYKKEDFHGASHLIHALPKDFLRKIFLDIPVHFYLQLLFPERVLIETSVSTYLMKYREEIIFANSKKVYETYLKYISYIELFNKKNPNYVKKFAYACLYANILIEYAQKDRSFNELYKPKEDWHKWLINLRLSEKVTEEHAKVFNEMFQQLAGLEQIYSKRENKVLLQRHREALTVLLDQ